MSKDCFTLPSSLQTMLKQIGKRPLLTAGQEQELARAMQAGDIEAFHELVEANIGLAVSIATKYRWLGLPYEDLVQEAICGLMTGIRKFDPGKGIRVSTYVTYWIEQAILRALKQNELIHIPEHFQEKVKQFAYQLRDLRAELGRMPTLSQIVLKLGLDEETVQNMFVAIQSIRSGDTPLLDDDQEEGRELLFDIIPDNTPTPDQVIGRLATIQAVNSVLSCLSDRDREIIRLRYGINKDYPRTLEEVGHIMKLSRERVRQIEIRALRKLRGPFKRARYNL